MAALSETSRPGMPRTGSEEIGPALGLLLGLLLAGGGLVLGQVSRAARQA
jgi:hypothetical protein